MTTEVQSKLEKSITQSNAEQLRIALSTIVGAELADRDLDTPDNSNQEFDIEPVKVTIAELAKSCPVPKAKCRLLMKQFASDVGTGITDGDGRGVYKIDPAA